jgi:hypothetical protein
VDKEFEKWWKNKKGRKARIEESIRDLLSQGQNCGKHYCSSRCQSMCLRCLGWTQEHKNHREDAMIYLGLG